MQAGVLARPRVLPLADRGSVRLAPPFPYQASLLLRTAAWIDQLNRSRFVAYSVIRGSSPKLSPVAETKADASVHRQIAVAGHADGDPRSLGAGRFGRSSARLLPAQEAPLPKF